jgi:hypothetical protein
MSETPNKLNSKANVNTILMVVVLAAIGWVGTNINEANKRLSILSEKIAVIDANNTSKIEQLNRIEAQLSRQQAQINDMQLDMVRIKGKP